MAISSLKKSVFIYYLFEFLSNNKYEIGLAKKNVELYLVSYKIF